MFLVCVVSFMNVMFVGGGVALMFVVLCVLCLGVVCLCFCGWLCCGCYSAAFIIVFECVDCCLNMWLFCLCL